MRELKNLFILNVPTSMNVVYTCHITLKYIIIIYFVMPLKYKPNSYEIIHYNDNSG